MIVAAQRPNFAPYPGFFRAALAADAVVLLDGVQFPRGTTWVSRNRLKGRDGELWLTVPVWKRGRGLQLIRDVEICREGRWIRKHLESLKAAYCHAPYLDLHLAFLETVYHRGHDRLVPFNLEILRHIWASVGLSSRLVLQSDVGVDGAGTELLTRLCGALGADVFVVQKAAGNYLDIAALERAGIAVRYVNPRPIVYPQLWGPFRPNLSILDMLFTCGPAARRLLRMDQEVSGDGGAVDHAQGVSRDGPH
ncbi:MAG: WbqC family protein [Candidatus Eisenbacteria bacterium]|jgi:hypothetical protein|nr:WbqC family protein [Candidatus Eisenbacteria bacterium]